MSKQDLMDSFMWDVKERIAKLEADNAKLVEVSARLLNENARLRAKVLAADALATFLGSHLPDDSPAWDYVGAYNKLGGIE